MTKEKLPIHKQFLVISSPVEFSLIANNGTDKVLRPAGVWQLDCFKLLPEKFMRNYPVFNLELEYDETKIPDGFTLEYYFTNMNLGDSLKGVSGDLVELSDYQFNTLKSIFSYTEDYSQYKVVSKVSKRSITDTYGGQITIKFSCITSKVLLFGCTITKGDDSKIHTFAYPIYVRTEETPFEGQFLFLSRLNVLTNSSTLYLDGNSLRLKEFGVGTFLSPTSNIITIENPQSLSFIDGRIKMNEISSIKSVDYYLLTP